MPYDRETQREYQRIWVAKRRRNFFADKECASCGSTEKLELDHIDPSTKIASVIWSWSQSRRDEELAKCQILCHDCHSLKTFYLDGSHVQTTHGTGNMYDKQKCRCKKCFDWKSRKNRADREKRNLNARLAQLAEHHPRSVEDARS